MKVWNGFTQKLHDPDPHFKQQNFHPSGVQRDPEIVDAFGSERPHSGSVLLHYAGDPEKPLDSPPVVLVHGANKDGNYWGDFPARLKEQGFRVYGLSFAHPHDDNYLQAEQVANVVGRVRELTGAEKVDLVAHSKGGVAARIYCSTGMHLDWMTPYGDDVRRLVLVGAPNAGIDYSYRHPSVNLALLAGEHNAPMTWEKYGVSDTSAQGYLGEPDYWPGQRQLLARWDSRYPVASFEPDPLTTYYGGQGLVSKSHGIDAAIEKGGYFMKKMTATPIDKGVEVALLAGDKPDIPGILNEYHGPSDGLLFVDSALAVPQGTNVVDRGVLHLNHKALVEDPLGRGWIANALRKQASGPKP